MKTEVFQVSPIFKNNYDKSPLYENGVKIVQTLSEHGFKAFFAGGFVRDAILGRKIKDIDIATDAKPEQVEMIFPQTFETGKAFGVINVIKDGYQYQIATFRKERTYEDGRHPLEVTYASDPSIDASRRDFTINAMYFCPLKCEVLDSYNGINDLKKGILRTVGDPDERFNEDHLRILRAIRFSAEYSLKIDEETLSAIRKSAHLLKKISAERIKEELDKILLGFDPARAFNLMLENGVLEVILPELIEMKHTPQDPEYHPEGDVFTHTMIMLSHMTVRSNTLAWSILLHDCAKSDTISKTSDGKLHFYGHEEKGATKALHILSRFKVSSDLLDNVSKQVRDHMKLAHTADMRPAKLARLLCSDNFSDLLELHRIDCMASHKRFESFLFLLDKYSEFKEKPKLPQPLVNGYDLIEAGLTPSPIFSKILNELLNRQIENPSLTKNELLALVPELVEKFKNSTYQSSQE